ncbi:MAG: metal ABC transporter permease [Phycisphaeraceae bacterium]|nr:metal ABC transporter permease [Phycisphaeraceae bacterium]
MELFTYLTDPLTRDLYLQALLAGTAVVVMCGVLSPIVVVRRLGFIGQGVSHSAFGGIGVAAVLAALGRLSPGGLAEFIVIVAFCVVAALGMGGVSRKRTLPEDTAIGLFLVGSMALGAILVQVSQNIAASRGVSASGRSWESILFGSILMAGPAETLTGILCAVGVLAALWWFRRPMLFHVFDEESARAFGVPGPLMRSLLMILLAVAVVTAMKLAGVVLATALLVLPGAIALRLSRRLTVVTAIAVAAGVVGLIGGLAVSAQFDFQPGPSVVLVLVALFAGAWMWERSPGRA